MVMGWCVLFWTTPKAEGQFQTQVPDSIRVRIGLPGNNLNALVPDGAILLTNGTEHPLPRGSTSINISDRGWSISIPPPIRPELSAIANYEANDAHHAIGHFEDRPSAERVRRILRSEFGVPTRISRSGWHISINTSLLTTNAISLEIVSEANSDQTITLNGQQYRGNLRLEPSDHGYLVTNDLLFEQYLYSVVGSEMPATWAPEALKAQAVAARTYAVRQLKPNADFDICDSPACQAYEGLEAESPASRAAVDATRGIIAVYDGEPIDAVYSANMGGHTAASEDVWTNRISYLRPVNSPFDEVALDSSWARDAYEWKVHINRDHLLSQLQERGYAMSSIEAINVVRDDGHGRATTVQVLGSPKPLTLHRDEIRYALGLKSTTFTVAVLEEQWDQKIFTAPGLDKTKAAIRSPRPPYRRSISFDTVPSAYQLHNGSVFTRAVLIPEQILFRGRGVGHGVGLSQWGAQGMALAGKSYEDILKHYYTGIDLTRTS